MKKEKRLVIIGFVVVFISILITGCGKIDLESEILEKVEEKKEEKELVADYGGVVTVPLTSLNTLNPLVTNNKSYYYFSKLVYEPLFEIDEKFQIQGILAESYEILDSGKRLAIRLRDDVYWHDGEKLKAEDVIFTIDTIKAAGVNSIYGDLLSSGLGGINKVNLNSAIKASGSNRDLYIEFDKSYGNNLDVLTFPIIPSHRFDSVNAALSLENYKPLGTGPFKFKSYTNLKEVSLEKNENYREGPAYLDQVKGKIYKTDEDLIRAFETGQVDMTITVGGDWEKYGKSDRMRTLEFPSTKYNFIGFNFNNKHFKEEDGIILRKAIMYGIDRDKLISRIYLNHCSKADSPIHPDSWLNDGELYMYGYDELRAKSELKKLGYIERDSEGYVVNEKGERISLNLLTNTYNNRRYRLAEAIKQDLKLIGIEVNIIPETPAKTIYTDEEIDQQWDYINKEVQLGRFDMFLGEWDFSIVSDLSFMFHTNARGNGNFINYSDPETDRLIEEVLYSGSSRDYKQEKTQELGMDILNKLPYASLFFKNKALVVGKNIHGDINPIISHPYKGMEKVFIKTKE